MTEPPDMATVWKRVEQLATTAYLQEGRLIRLEDDLADWFERVTPIIEENSKQIGALTVQIANLRNLIENYIRGIKNGGQLPS